MTELRDELAKAIYDADEDFVTANINNSTALTAEAKAEWHESIGPKKEWPDIHAETRAAYQMRADACLAIITPLLDKARADALEEAAKACDGEKYTQAGVNASFRDGDGRAGDHNETCEELATAIRELKGKHND